MRRFVARPWFVGALVALTAVACVEGTTPPPDIATTTFAPALNVHLASMTKTASGLYYQDSVTTAGVVAATGDSVTVQYTLWLPNGSLLETSVGGPPLPFRLGRAQVIPGWDEGITGMRIGGIRKLVIPPSLAYGDQASAEIPANSILVFNVQLVAVFKGS